VLVHFLKTQSELHLVHKFSYLITKHKYNRSYLNYRRQMEGHGEDNGLPIPWKLIFAEVVKTLTVFYGTSKLHCRFYKSTPLECVLK
jgi:hypothetical protein